MSMVIKHTIASSLILILCVIFFIESLGYPSTAARLPQILIIIIAILSILMFVESLKKEKKKDTPEDKKETTEKINITRVVIFITMIAAYIFLMDILGYFILTPLFIFGVLMYLKATKVVIAILLSVGFTAFVYGLFAVFLRVPVPSGIFF